MGNCIAFDKHSDDTYFTQIRRKYKLVIFMQRTVTRPLPCLGMIIMVQRLDRPVYCFRPPLLQMYPIEISYFVSVKVSLFDCHFRSG